MIFHQTNCNYVGVPEGWVELEAGESILRLKSMRQCKIKRYYKNPSDLMDDTKRQEIEPQNTWYKVRAGDCSLYVALISGDDVQTLDNGNIINCRQLSDQYFNGTSTPNVFPVVDFPIISHI